MIQVPISDVTLCAASGADPAIPFPYGFAGFFGEIDQLVFLDT